MKLFFALLTFIIGLSSCSDSTPECPSSNQRSCVAPENYEKNYKISETCKTALNEKYTFNIIETAITEEGIDIEFTNNLSYSGDLQIYFQDSLFSYGVICSQYDCSRLSHLSCEKQTSTLACNINEVFFFEVDNLDTSAIYFNYSISDFTNIEACSSKFGWYFKESELIKL